MSFKVENLHKAYRQRGENIAVLSGVELSLEPGDSLAIVGQSGVGKSTLLHCLGLLDSFDQGRISLQGDLLAEGGRAELSSAQQRRRHVGFVFQFHYLMAELTAEENVMVPLLLSGTSQADASRKAANILGSVGLSHRLHHRPSELSGGEQQRVAIARALVHEPKLILADEPTGNLDPKTAESVFHVLKDQCLRLKAILIMATHNLELAKYLDHQKTLLGGKLQ